MGKRIEYREVLEGLLLQRTKEIEKDLLKLRSKKRAAN
jgi:hypothetical protein